MPMTAAGHAKVDGLELLYGRTSDFDERFEPEKARVEYADSSQPTERRLE